MKKNYTKTTDDEILLEFGGPTGAGIIMIFSHCLMIYFYVSVTFHQGGLFYPSSISNVIPWLRETWTLFWSSAAPTWYAAKIYLIFMTFEAILAVVLPGPIIKGLPVPSEGNIQHEYICNGVSSWYLTLIILGLLHYFDIFRLSEISLHLGPLMTTSMIFGNLLAVAIHVMAFVLGKQIRVYGNTVYDFFMGVWLNPRIGKFDFKMWAEIRISWMMLFILTLSAAVRQYELYGTISDGMILMLFAHGLYTNACMKGEECIPTTWDIFYEKWGWMLIFWNVAGVPFVYCFQSYFILQNEVESFSWPLRIALFGALFFAYYIWDTSQSQKNHFRMKLRGTYIERSTFPQLPWKNIENPKYLRTETGSYLLTDGWWQYARKIHYTADIVMAFCWGASSGFRGILPFFYVIFFTAMILHRYRRDYERCQKKYGKDWDKYVSIVPYAFIPGIL